MSEKTAQPNSKNMDSVRFISLVSMFASSAYGSMGKLANPMTGKIERDLDAARGFIDMLIMLKAKTAGNLSREEEKMIATAISDLQLNFVREKDRPEPLAPAPEDRTSEDSAPEDDAPEAPPAPGTPNSRSAVPTPEPPAPETQRPDSAEDKN